MPRTKNRRRERRHVLDVKLASNQVRRRRTQLVVSALFAVTFLTFTVYGLWRGGWWALQRFVYQNEQLQVREVQVRTDGVINPEHLRRWAGVKPGDSLFAIDLHGIKHELEMHGMIRQASLERVLPGTLRLQVAERIPLAHVRLRFSGADGRLLTRDFGLDETGRVMPLDRAIVRPETANAWRQLPELTGIAESEILPGNDLTNQLGHAALEFLKTFNSDSMAREVQIQSIDLTEPEILKLRTVQGHDVEVLDRGFVRQLDRWEALHKACESNRVGYAWMDLSPSNNIPIRLVQLKTNALPLRLSNR